MAGPKESSSVVTSAQRARLVIALGVLNLVLATFALAVGFTAPRPPDRGIAGIDQTPAASAPVATPLVTPTGGPSTPAPTESPVGTTSPTPPSSAEPTPSAVPSSEPSPTGVMVAVNPSPAASAPAATPAATPVANPPVSQPTTNPPAATPSPAATPPAATAAPATPEPAQPTAKPPKPTPAPTPKPVTKPARLRPPCPGTVAGPPGHNKSTASHGSCKGGHGKAAKDKDSTKGKAKGGFVIILPPVAAAVLGPSRRRVLRPLQDRLRAR